LEGEHILEDKPVGPKEFKLNELVVCDLVIVEREDEVSLGFSFVHPSFEVSGVTMFYVDTLIM